MSSSSSYALITGSASRGSTVHSPVSSSHVSCNGDAFESPIHCRCDGSTESDDHCIGDIGPAAPDAGTMSASAASAMCGPAFGGVSVPAGVRGTPGTTKRLLSTRKCSNDPGCPIMVLGSVVCGVPGGGPRGAIGSATAPITRRGDRGLSWVGGATPVVGWRHWIE